MSQTAEPVPLPQQQAADASSPDNEEVDTLAALEDIGRDYELLSKRIHTMVRNAQNNTQEVSVLDALRLQGETVMLLMDHLTHLKRMEDHAEWASELLENLSEAAFSETETSSQLHQVDADRYMVFLDEMIADIDSRLEAVDSLNGDAVSKDELKAWRERALELKALTEEITLQPTDGDDGEGDDDGEAPTKEAAGETQ